MENTTPSIVTPNEKSHSVACDDVVSLPKTILVADDDHILRAVAAMTLDAESFNVLEAEDGLAAMSVLKQNPVDLVLLDLGMPRMDGFQVLKNIRTTERFMNIPVIVITGLNDSEAIEKALSIGATSFVTKPLDWTILIHHIKFVLRASALEAEQREARQTAENLSQLKGYLLSIISHEFRTPMNAISGFSELIDMTINDQGNSLGLKAISNYLGDIKNATRRMDSIMTDILLLSNNFSKTLVLRNDDHSVDEIITEVRDTLESKFRDKNIQLILDYSGFESFEIYCDIALLSRALNHLLENSLNFSDSGKSVYLQVRQTDDDALCLRVIDAGSGMSDDQIKNAKNIFSQSDMTWTRTVEGLGLGLAVTQMIGEYHDGRLELSSKQGIGTVASLIISKERISNTQGRLSDVQKMA